jgi:hypothetical protein
MDGMIGEIVQKTARASPICSSGCSIPQVSIG